MSKQVTIEATRVRVSKQGLPHVDVWVGFNYFPDSLVDQTIGVKAQTLIEDAEHGWLLIWWFTTNMETAKK